MPRKRTGLLVHRENTGWNARLWVDTTDPNGAVIKERRWFPLKTFDRQEAEEKMRSLMRSFSVEDPEDRDWMRAEALWGEPKMTETDLLNLLIERAPHALPHVRIFRRNILNVETKLGFRARNGIKGQSDAYAYTRGGKVVEIETKAARGTLAEAQKAWRTFCETWGIPHLVLRARPNEQPDDTVARWIEELRSKAA